MGSQGSKVVTVEAKPFCRPTRDDSTSGIASKHPTPVCVSKQHHHYCTTFIRGAIRAYGGMPFDSVETVKMVTRKFVMEREGMQQSASLCGKYVTILSQRDHFGIGRSGSRVSLNNQAEALLFSLLVHLAQNVEDGTKDFGQASLRRAVELTERLNNFAKETRTFHARNVLLAVSTPFRLPFVDVYNKDVREWAEEETA